MSPNTASASVFPWMCAMPQSSRVIETFFAICSQRAASGLVVPRAALQPARTPMPRIRARLFIRSGRDVDEAYNLGDANLAHQHLGIGLVERFGICKNRYGRFDAGLPDGGRKSTRQIVEPDVTHCGYTSRFPSGETIAYSAGVSVAVVNRVGRSLPLTGTRTT